MAAEFSMRNIEGTEDSDTLGSMSGQLSASQGFSTGGEGSGRAGQTDIGDDTFTMDDEVQTSDTDFVSDEPEDEGLTRGQQKAIFGSISTAGGLATEIGSTLLESQWKEEQKEKMKNLTSSNRAYKKNLDRMKNKIRDSYQELKKDKFNLQFKKQKAKEFGHYILEVKKNLRQLQQNNTALSKELLGHQGTERSYLESAKRRWGV